MDGRVEEMANASWGLLWIVPQTLPKLIRTDSRVPFPISLCDMPCPKKRQRFSLKVSSFSTCADPDLIVQPRVFGELDVLLLRSSALSSCPPPCCFHLHKLQLLLSFHACWYKGFLEVRLQASTGPPLVLSCHCGLPPPEPHKVALLTSLCLLSSAPVTT